MTIFQKKIYCDKIIAELEKHTPKKFFYDIFKNIAIFYTYKEGEKITYALDIELYNLTGIRPKETAQWIFESTS